ncbi:MAG: cysteine desulfurase family protein [Oceanibaculum nanhaiense]|uniref:cysteine desulfurase family protein n=1 Tax=Oceanibaculum nanhaiense TaxID=1909734 RepID=UPI0025A31B56|nr:cysteine desulfurase family protein [Oceanibaculum nanhaiense]MDM7946603.1 cysteine desulfurase family protein [Oceanibaculum nanhaiense]
MTITYLDHNATTPVRPEAMQAVLAAMQEGGNPSSVHAAGRTARKRLEQARRDVAALIGGDAAGLVFTSGGTEANALALLGSGRPRILYSAIEHDSVRAVHPQAEPVPVTSDGVLDLGALDALLASDSRPAIVSLMLANNETGILQPVAEAREIAHRHGALIHCDAIQAAGKLPLDVTALGVDLMSLSGHKIGGPPGVGALYIRPGLDLAAIQRGGGQERRLRGGTENLPGIAGFGAAARAAADIDRVQALAGWRDALEAGVLAATPQAVIVGQDMPRLPNTSCIALPGMKAENIVMALDLAGVAVSAGSACSSGKVTASHVLAAMGLPPGIAGGAIRVSFGWTSTAADVDAFLAAWSQTARRLRPMAVAS